MRGIGEVTEGRAERGHPLGSVCPKCGKIISRGQYLCNDCEEERYNTLSDLNGYHPFYRMPKWALRILKDFFGEK